MGLPDGYTDVPYRGRPATDRQRLRVIGNSFPVPVVRWIGEGIATVERYLNAPEGGMNSVARDRRPQQPPAA